MNTFTRSNQDISTLISTSSGDHLLGLLVNQLNARAAYYSFHRDIDVMQKLQIGELLLEAKSILPHGYWVRWVKRYNFDLRMSRHMMSVRRAYTATAVAEAVVRGQAAMAESERWQDQVAISNGTDPAEYREYKRAQVGWYPDDEAEIRRAYSARFPYRILSMAKS